MLAHRLVAGLVLGAFVATAPGCATAAPQAAGAGNQAAATVANAAGSKDSSGVEHSGITGVWEGVSRAGCSPGTSEPTRCDAMQNITLTMIQQGKTVTGYYKCAYGSSVCRNMDESGVIKDGRMIGKRMMVRVMLEDGSMCFFTAVPRDDLMEGTYSCLQGGGIVENGLFRATRSY